MHKRVTCTEKDNVIGQIDKIWEISIQGGHHPLICCMYLVIAVSQMPPLKYRWKGTDVGKRHGDYLERVESELLCVNWKKRLF